MQLQRFTDPQAFYDRVAPFLMTHEAENNLPLGLVAALMQDIQRYGDDPPYLALVEDDGQVVHMALRTPPHKLILSTTDTLDAITLFVQDTFAKYGDSLPGVNGPSPVSKAFAEHWQTITGQSYRKTMAMRIFRLDVVNPVTAVPGQIRPVNKGDRTLMIDWIKAFYRDVMDKEYDDEWAERSFERYLDPDNPSELYAWEDGGVVSIVGCGRPTRNGVSIAPVYTPPEKRRRGYASACVATLSQHLLDRGHKFCFLYTDLANPTSNHIYQEIGYRPVCDADEYEFS